MTMCPSSSSDDTDTDSDVHSLWENVNTSRSLSSDSSPYDVPMVEAHLYYAGLSGPGGRGPRLVYRTTREKEPFIPPTGFEAYRRLMELRTVPESHKLGENNLWDEIRAQVVKLLDKRGIQFTSVDLVRFTWTEPRDDQEDVESEDEEEEEANLTYDDIAPIKPVGDGTIYTTPVTIWVGVMPDSLTGEVAHHSSNDIIKLLKRHDITNVEVAYRESVTTFLVGMIPRCEVPCGAAHGHEDLVINGAIGR